MKGPEGKIQDKSLAWLRRQGWEVVKIVICSRPGWPDAYIARDGRHGWIEFKKPGEEPEKLQKEIHRRLRKNGVFVLVIDDFKELKRVISNM